MPNKTINDLLLLSDVAARTTSYMPIWDGTNNTTKKVKLSDLGSNGLFFIDNTNSRIGIGTTTPEQELEVAESAGSPVIQVSDGTRKLQMGSDSNNPFIGTSTAHDLKIISNNTEQMRIKSDGKVGIGTTSPEQELDVVESEGSPIVQVSDGTRKLHMGSDSNNPFIGTSTNHDLRIISNNTEQMIVKSDGKVGIGTSSPTQKLEVIQGAGTTTKAVVGGGTAAMLVINGDRDNVGDANLEDSSLLFASDGAYPSSGNPGFGYRIGQANGGANSQLIFTEIKTNADVERMRIDEDGNVGIGTAAPSAKLDVNGAIQSASISHPSDYRLKENIKPLENTLDKIKNLKPVSYNFKEDGSYDEGLIAHEVQEIFPSLVTGDKDAKQEDGSDLYQSVAYGKLVTHLVKAVQELSAEVERLKNG